MSTKRFRILHTDPDNLGASMEIEEAKLGEIGDGPKDGYTFITVDGIRWQVDGTKWAYKTLVKKVRKGEAVEVEE